MTAFLGIDIGSTALKAAAFDEAGVQLALARIEYRKPYQGADDWWRATLRAMRQLLRTNPGLEQEVRGIGLSGRAGSRVLLDRGGRALATPTGVTASPESLARAVELAGSRRGGHGLRFLAALLQMRREHPREFERAARAMMAKDYVAFQMTGHAVTDPASSLDSGAWAEGVLTAPELAHIRLPEVRQPWEEAGRLRGPIADQIGLPAGLVVATGAHDGAAAAIGGGAAFAGAHAVTLGTNSVYRIVVGGEAGERSRFWTLLPGLTAYGADVTLGGYAVDWAARMLGSTHDRLARAAHDVSPGADGLVFLPQMGGRVLPDPNAGVSGAFAGIRRSTRQGHLYRSVLEGNAFALRAAREALLAQDLPDGPIYLTGGGTRSPLWRHILADVFGKAVRWYDVEEGCRGAAMFAAVACGEAMDMDAAIGAMTGEPHVLEPGANSHGYDRAYQRFIRVRGALDDA